MANSRAMAWLRVNAVAVVLVVWALSEPVLLDVPATVSWLGCLGVAAALSLPLLAIRRWPVGAAIVVALAYLLNLLVDARPVGGVAAELVLAYALYCACAHRAGDDWRRWAGVVIGATGFATGWLLHELGVGELKYASLALAMYIGGVIVAGVAPGMSLRDRRDEVRALRGEVATLEETLPDQVDEAVEVERDALDRSIARVVTGLVEEIRRLAADASAALATDPRAAAAGSSRMADVSGAAIRQLREMVGTLHAAPDAPPLVEPARRSAHDRHLRRLVDAAALAAPWLLLSAFGVIDQLLAPDLPLDVTAWGMTFHVGEPTFGGTAAIVLAILTPLALLGRRRAPVLAVAITMAFVAARTWNGDLSSVTFAQTFVGVTAAFIGAAWARNRRDALIAGALAFAGTTASWVLEQAVFSPMQYAYMAAALAAGWAAGWALRGHIKASAELRAEARALEIRRDELAERAVVAERRRVARELHDVIGHGLSLISVQAGAAQVLCERDKAAAADALRHIESAAAGALSELRLLRELLADPDLPAVRRPLPAVRRLIDEAAAAGQTVRADVDPELDAVPASVGAVAVRVVQEALTNARKHASGSPAEVAVEIAGGRVLIRVETTRSDTARAPASARGGHGLEGMAERVAAVGGVLEAGPHGTGGGWLVHAELPLAAS